MISIVIPIYNVEKHIEKCLDSVLNQTYKNIELILADDGSTDRSGEICDRYAAKDSRIKIIQTAAYVQQEMPHLNMLQAITLHLLILMII